MSKFSSRQLSLVYLFIIFILYTALTCQHLGAVDRFANLVLRTLHGFQLPLRSSVCNRTPRLQPKYQTTGVNCTALCGHSQVQPYSAQLTVLACQCRGPRIISQICSGDRGIEPRTLRISSRVFNHSTTQATTQPPRPLVIISCYRQLSIDIGKLLIVIGSYRQFSANMLWLRKHHNKHHKNTRRALALTKNVEGLTFHFCCQKSLESAEISRTLLAQIKLGLKLLSTSKHF